MLNFISKRSKFPKAKEYYDKFIDSLVRIHDSEENLYYKLMGENEFTAALYIKYLGGDESNIPKNVVEKLYIKVRRKLKKMNPEMIKIL